MISYSVYVEAHIAESIAQIRLRERSQIIRLLRKLRINPFIEGDYVERDSVGRLTQVIIIGSHAVVFWVDHAVKEVKVIDLRLAGR